LSIAFFAKFLILNFITARPRSLNPMSNKVGPIDADIFNRTKSFFITNHDDLKQLPIALPMSANELDFNQASSGLNFETITSEKQKMKKCDH
jgi:hypothetical protein